MSKRLRWKMRPPETGLRAIGAGPRPRYLHDGETEFATVYAHSTRHAGKTGWYWVAVGNGVPLRNTCAREIETVEQAKKEALEYVKACLAARGEA
jgi:hypothetical protein